MADTVALPPIPDGAREAVAAYLGCLPTAPIVTDVIEAARPHLYAATLRHAADTAFQTGDQYIDGRPALFALDAETRLRRMADEASRG